ncbi:MAG TPA: amino acid adenylation domain-containing protein, partial [Steroidobacteraceae bacterium]
TQRLRELARMTGTSLFMVLLAAYYVCLHKLTGQEDIVVGIASNGRTGGSLSTVVGMCVNTLAIRMTVGREQTFHGWMDELKEYLLQCFDHQNYPFEKLVAKAPIERDPYRQPLFDTMFVFESADEREFRIGDARFTEIYLKPGVAMCDLTVETFAFAHEIRFAIQYCTALFTQDAVERFARYFRNIVGAVLARPTVRLSEIEYLSAAERQQLLIVWGQGPRRALDERCLHQLFEEQVARAPQSTALVFGREKMSYSQLNEHANRVAHYLTRQGARPDTLVGLCVERSLDMVVGMLGTLKAGAAYLPIDSAYPAERIRILLRESGVRMVLSQSHLLRALPATEMEVLLLDTDEEAHGARGVLARQACGNLSVSDVSLRPENLAYVIYTSGSTGKPKGVMIEHKGWVNLALAQRALFSAGPGSRGLQFASLSFDAAAFEISMMLTGGGTLYLVSDAQHRTAQLLDAVAQEHQLTHATLPPVLLPHLTVDKWRSISTLIVAGEAITPALAQQWRQGRRLFNAYGPTETTVCATVGEVVDERITIGGPLCNTVVRVLDSDEALVPVGVTGELCVGGVQLARGYLNQPQMTRERFIPDPFRMDARDRLYKTGDLARWNAHGRLEFLGRVDDQVKIRGHRIELGEIEARLALHPHIKEAAVLARGDTAAEKQLVAYVTVGDADFQGIGCLREYLESWLPDVMIPAAFVVMARLPLTTNGKLDRRALPEPDASSYVREQYVAPEGAVEEFLAGVWEELLRIRRVGRHDSFFKLGGHSITATQVMARIRASFAVDLPVSVLFSFHTLAELSAAVTQLHKARTLDPGRRRAEGGKLLEPGAVPKSEARDLIRQHNVEGLS